MKKNIILLGVFVALLLGAYLYEERGKAILNEKKEKEETLFNVEGLGNLKSFKNNSFSFIHRDGHYFSEETNRLIDIKKLDEIFKVLGSIKIKRILEPSEYGTMDEKLFFDNEDQKISFVFENGTIEFVLGKKIDYDQTFYMKVKELTDKGVLKTNWVIADDSSALDEVYQKDTAHRSPRRYQRLQRIITSKEDLIRDMHLFPLHFISGKNNVFKSAEISFKARPTFKIDFVSKTTMPTKDDDKRYNVEKFHEFSEKLRLLEASSERPGQLNEEQKVAAYSIVDTEDNIIQMNLYAEGELYFVTTDLLPNIIFGLKERPTFLLIHWEDFWTK